MGNVTRRDFLRTGLLATGMASIPGSLTSIIASAQEVSANSVKGSIQDVEHVVILMLENRSFDHYFGTMQGVRGFGDPFPIPLESGKPVWFESDGEREVPPFHLDMSRMNALKCDTTSHEFADTQAAWNQGRYGFWPKFKIDMINQKTTGHSMGFYTRKEIPFQFALAEAFTICDNYHCGVLSGTDPNRIFFWSGANYDPQRREQGLHHTPEDSEPNNLRCWVAGDWPDPGYAYLGKGFNWPTIPDVLQDAGISWRFYQDPNDNWEGAMNGCLAFNSFRNAKKGSAIYNQGMSYWSLYDLANHVEQETLPQVSWILPSQSDCEHSAGSSPASGALFTAKVLDALVGNPKVWSKTVLFITFDENDGYFDHIPPPAVPSLNADGSMAGASTLDVRGMYFEAPGFEPYHDKLRARTNAEMGVDKPAKNIYLDSRDREAGLVRPYGMGPRVPMYVVSPWSKGGWVSSQVFDHTSVGQFLEKRFGVVIPAISPWNRAVAGDLTGAFDFESPDDAALPKLPETKHALIYEAMQITMPPATPPQENLTFWQDSGTRPSRPTPYVQHVTSQANEDGTISLHFMNDGHQGAVFHVYDRFHLGRIPRRYTVEAGKSLEDNAWDTSDADGAYDLEVYSANGFVRTFKGNVSEEDAAMLHLSILYDVRRSAIRALIHNPGAKLVKFQVKPNKYIEDGQWTASVGANESIEQSWNIADYGNWYDFTVTAPGFERRFAGRMENGSDLTSDPAMGT